MAKLKPIGLIAVICIAITCFAVLGSVSFWTKLEDLHAQEYVAALNNNEQRANQLSEAATQQFDSTVRSVDTALQYLRDVYVKDRQGFEKAVRIVLTNYPAGMFDLVVVTDPQGYLSYASSGFAKRIYLGDREHIAVHASSNEDQLWISPPLHGRIGDAPIVPLSRPVYDHGKFAGTISIPLRPQYFANKFNALQVAPDDLLAIVRADGSFIARNHKLEEALKTKLPPNRPFLAASPGMNGIFRDVSTVDKIPLVFAWRRLTQWPVSIVVAVNEAREMKLVVERQARERNRAQMAILALLAASVGVGVLLIRLIHKNGRLVESESRFRHFFEKNGSVMLLIDPANGQVINANAAASHFYGYTHDALLHMNVNQINTLAPQAIAEEMAHAKKEERNYFYFPHRLASGEVRSVEVYSTPITIDQNVFLFSIVNDITERRRTEEHMRELQARLQASHDLLARLSEHIPGVMYQYRLYPDGRSTFPYASQAIEDIYEVRLEEVRQDASVVFRRLHPEDLDAVSASIQASANTLTPWKHDYRVNLPHQGLRWLSGIANPMQLEDGSILWHGFIKDVTDRKLLEQIVLDRIRDMNTILENSSVGITFVKGRNQVWANQRMAEIFGYRMDELQNQSTRKFYPSEREYDEVGQSGYAAIERGERYVSERQMVTKHGQLIWVRISGKAVDAANLDAGSIWVFEDITEQKRVETRLQLAASVFTHAREGIMITDAQGNIIDVNDTFTLITGYARDEAIGKNPRMLNSGMQSDEFYAEVWKSLIEKDHWYGEMWNRRKNGEVFAEMQTISAIRDAEGKTQHYVSLFSDITPLKMHEQELERIAHYDALTQLPNRVLLADRLRQGLILSQRHKHSLAVVFLDLDGFKHVNDLYGHAAGDKLLIEVAQRIKGVLREGDTLSRIGGDEFVAILADLDNVQSCEPVLARMLQAACSPVMHADSMLQVSASMGVTLYPQDGADADLLMRQADQAMYSAKEAGKNRYHMFDIAQNVALKTRRETVEHIEKALRAREFELYYQPKIDLVSGQLVGVEALIRWQHSARGLLLPSEFLPIIEDHAFSIELGEWVLESALAQISRWRSQGLHIAVSVNIGARQLQHADFVERLQRSLATFPDVPPDQLQIEVLETSALQDLLKVGSTMNVCQELGVSFALDDFGTGYSSLTYLKHLPARTLKIDQSFIRDMLNVESDLAIVNGVIGLARAFGRDVIAEGVETREHARLLLSLGCEMVQGFGIAAPMPADAVPRWLAHWQARPDWLQ